MGSKKYLYAFTDGGARKWAVVFRSGGGVHSQYGDLHETANNDDTESMAILKACEYAEGVGGNWRIVTDSQAIIDKVMGNCANATRNPNVNGIKNVMDRVNSSPKACSISLMWMRRMSEPEMVEADRLCKE